MAAKKRWREARRGPTREIGRDGGILPQAGARLTRRSESHAGRAAAGGRAVGGCAAAAEYAAAGQCDARGDEQRGDPATRPA
ncbi:conserved hypothetical protein [Burkholderia cenocepacia HI2424]|uniref:Uncharacterized protein n=1 Tax=Burkholderia orbicola (strain AU 1054) TaxID=331271 RepID=A0A0H2XR85_BURO1|nr:conserved hypothetical protein [Burkholderia cenocepacia HI2424]